MIKREDFGVPFALHASREIDPAAYSTIEQIAPELFEQSGNHTLRPWWKLGRITSAVIAVATVDHVVFSDKVGSELVQLHNSDQGRWFFGPVGYVLRDVKALASPVRCGGKQPFWYLPPDIERVVLTQIGGDRG